MNDDAHSFADRLRERLRDMLRPRGRAAEEQLRDTIEEIIEEGEAPAEPMGAAERAILANVLRLREVTAEDVMVPRADIIAVDYGIALEELVAFLVREAHSRVPVFRGSLDEVQGFVHVKDVLRVKQSGEAFNLADVLRKRAQMKLKIKAMSSEAKASAYIVGALPFIVFALIYSINPVYMGGFFVDERLIIAGLGGLIWLGLGAFIMAQMVSFEI